MLRSHVDDTGRHLHPTWQPCLNFTSIGLGKPKGGTLFDPVMNWSNLANESPSQPA